jgi:alcohol dehydrogenase
MSGVPTAWRGASSRPSGSTCSTWSFPEAYFFSFQLGGRERPARDRGSLRRTSTSIRLSARPTGRGRDTTPEVADLHPLTRILFGRGAFDALGGVAGGWGERALVVTDRGMVATGLVGRASEMLRASGVEPVIFDGVAPNPSVEQVEAGLRAGADRGIGVIVSIGGGSAHDCAKAIALVAANGGETRDYEGVDRSPHRALPLIAVNTTAARRSVSRFAVVTDSDARGEMIIADRHLIPRVAINDP